MVDEQIVGRGMDAPPVLMAMRTVPRHEFLPPDLGSKAYEDRALLLGPAQTVSQPFIVALMSELAELRAGESVLEVGTGSGYQAAVLAEMCVDVFTIEKDPALAEMARQTLARLHYRQVHVRCGEGREGWPEAAPFGAILVTACTHAVPPALIEQLAPGGRLVAPIAEDDGQVLRVFRKTQGGELRQRDSVAVRFVPLT